MQDGQRRLIINTSPICTVDNRCTCNVKGQPNAGDNQDLKRRVNHFDVYETADGLKQDGKSQRYQKHAIEEGPCTLLKDYGSNRKSCKTHRRARRDERHT
jgi:hypothetical protein